MPAKKRKGPSKKGRGKPRCRSGIKTPKAPFDPTKPLKRPLQEAFAQNLINGEVITVGPRGGISVATPVMTECYVSAGYKATGHAAESNASRLMKNAEFSARLDYLRQQQADMLAERGVAGKEECCMVLTEMIRARHTDFLSMGADGVWFNDIGEETLNTAALKKVKTRIVMSEKGENESRTQYDEIELTDKIAAIKCLSEIMGFAKADDQKDTELDIFTRFVNQVTHVPEDQRSPQTG